MQVKENSDGSIQIMIENNIKRPNPKVGFDSAGAEVTLRFAPGDVLPMNWIRGRSAICNGNNFSLELQSGSVELLTPGLYNSNSSSDCSNAGLFRATRLSASEGRKVAMHYTLSKDIISDTSDGDSDSRTCPHDNRRAGWYQCGIRKQWAWQCSMHCRLRAGRNGATVTIKIAGPDKQSPIDATESSTNKFLQTSDSSIISDTNKMLVEVANLLLPHTSMHRIHLHKELVQTTVASLEAHASIIKVAPHTDHTPANATYENNLHAISAEAGPVFMGPEDPLLVLLEGELTLREREAGLPVSNNDSAKKTERILAKVIANPLLRKRLSDKPSHKEVGEIPTYTMKSGGACVLDASTLLSPQIHQQIQLSNFEFNAVPDIGQRSLYWLPEKECRFLVLDRCVKHVMSAF